MNKLSKFFSNLVSISIIILFSSVTIADFDSIRPNPSKLIKPKSPQVLEKFIKHALIRDHVTNPIVYRMLEASAAEDTTSTTNLIEDGVDEADQIKFINNHMYVSQEASYSWSPIDTGQHTREPASIHAVKVSSKPTQNWVGKYYLDDRAYWVPGLYTFENQLVALSAQSRAPMDWYTPYQWTNSKVGIESINIENPNYMLQKWRYLLDGYLVDSRRIGNKIYLITRFNPSLPGLTPGWNQSTREQNRALINAATLSDFIPTIELNNGRQKPLFSPRSCYIPEGKEWFDYGYSIFTAVTVVDIDNPNQWQSSCALTPVNDIYMNQDALYLINSQSWFNQTSQVHRFEFAKRGMQYTDSTAFEGSLGWNNAKFRIKEENGVLTLVTTQRIESNIIHEIQNFSTSQGTIIPLAILPNVAAPQPIGKPGEDIKGVRIKDGKIYLVTFRTTDPLYVIDNTDPTNPVIEGELVIPGFSDYLHQMTNDYLVGVGYGANEQGQTKGVKVSLYSTEQDNPVEVSQWLRGDRGSYSPVAWDHHAFTSLDVNDEFRFAIPATIRGQNWEYDFGGLGLFSVISKDKSPRLVNVGWIERADTNLGYRDRSIIQGNAVHYVSGSIIKSTKWHDHKNILTMDLKQQ